MKKNKVPVVTVDGPVGSGKGSLSVMLAKHLGFHLLDSGALYRVLALALAKKNIALIDEEKIQEAASKLDIKFIEQIPGEPAAIILEGEDVSSKIRTEQCGEAASKISSYPIVRQSLMHLQRDFARSPGLVADGRDMGTIVFPDAPVKFFLTASQEVRAQRRLKQLEKQGLSVDYAILLADIKERDARDTNRKIAPLKPADDAIILDSTEMTFEEVSQSVKQILAQKSEVLNLI